MFNFQCKTVKIEWLFDIYPISLCLTWPWHLSRARPLLVVCPDRQCYMWWNLPTPTHFATSYYISLLEINMAAILHNKSFGYASCRLWAINTFAVIYFTVHFESLKWSDKCTCQWPTCDLFFKQLVQSFKWFSWIFS